MRRRAFIAGLGSVAAWPTVVRAQRAGQVRRVGLLMNVGSDDPEGREQAATFTKELQQLHQADGGDVQIEIRWAAGNPENFS
jgi:putative ABC transport system substrate-binding protein